MKFSAEFCYVSVFRLQHDSCHCQPEGGRKHHLLQVTPFYVHVYLVLAPVCHTKTSLIVNKLSVSGILTTRSGNFFGVSDIISDFSFTQSYLVCCQCSEALEHEISI